MRVYRLAAILFAGGTAGSPVDYVLSALAPNTPSVNAAAPCATPTSAPPTFSSMPSYYKDSLELRQAPGSAPVAAPPVEIAAPAVPAAIPGGPPSAVDPLVALAPAPATPPANQAVPPAPPAAPLPPVPATTTSSLAPLLTGDDFVTVQWIETYIGTVRTWVPQTETFHFKPMSQAPLPGVGSIGMGTLAGKTGQTQTV